MATIKKALSPEEQRDQYVVKANDLIRKTRYDLTAQQQKIVLYTISKIKPDDDISTVYTFDIKELADACGMRNKENNSFYTRIRADLHELTARQWCTMPDGVQMTVSWIGDVKMYPGSGMVQIRFNPNLQPFLFDLQEKYTQYKLYNVLAFRGKYAIRLYEILRSYTTQTAIDNYREKEIDIPLEKLRYQLDVENVYKTWKELKRRVIQPAIDEINELAEDIHIEYYPMTERGRTIRKINFVITTAGIKQKYEARKVKRDMGLLKPAGEAR